jgi:molybdopterin/thiamine biosynthesis adenylyltransferase
MLSQEQQTRYARHVALPEIGEAGQQKLLDARILVIGAGGLGSPALLYLAAAGVGTLGVADADTAELSNLQRQVLHDMHALGVPKTDSARQKIRAINPDVRVIAHACYVAAENIAALLCDYDFVLDCTDNFASKFQINDACVAAGKPFCHAGIAHFAGQLMTWLPNGAYPCYRCVFPAPPPPEAAPKAGPVGALPGVVGSLQAMEALKYILGTGTLLAGRLLIYDALGGTFRQIPLQRRGSCTAAHAQAASK